MHTCLTSCECCACAGEGKYDSSLARVAARMAVDEKNMWSLLSELKMDDNKKTGLTFTPNIEIVFVGSTPITLKGTMTLKEGRKADIDLTAAKGTSAVMTCKGQCCEIKVSMSRLLMKIVTNLLHQHNYGL